jgi:hypothetical protein
MKKRLFACIAICSFVFYSCQKGIEERENEILKEKTVKESYNSLSAPQPIIQTHWPTNPPPQQNIPPDCVKSMINNRLTNQTPNAEEFINDGNTSLYLFRDNFLYQTAKGVKYAEDYYKISNFIQKHNLCDVALNDLYKTLSYAVEVSNKMASSNNTQVIVNDEIFSFLKAKEAQIRTHPNFNEVSTIFNYLATDLEVLKGKNKIQVINFFNGNM